MKLAVKPIIVFCLFMFTQSCIELSYEFSTVGVAALREYTLIHWFVLAAKLGGTLGATALAWVDPSLNNYKNSRNAPPPPPPSV